MVRDRLFNAVGGDFCWSSFVSKQDPSTVYMSHCGGEGYTVHWPDCQECWGSTVQLELKTTSDAFCPWEYRLMVCEREIIGLTSTKYYKIIRAEPSCTSTPVFTCNLPNSIPLLVPCPCHNCDWSLLLFYKIETWVLNSKFQLRLTCPPTIVIPTYSLVVKDFTGRIATDVRS
jgi:hypothetical protein